MITYEVCNEGEGQQTENIPTIMDEGSSASRGLSKVVQGQGLGALARPVVSRKKNYV